jgi:hypothetical protein
MVSTPSRFIARKCQRACAEIVHSVLRLALRFRDAAVRSVFIIALQFAFAPRDALAIRHSMERVVFEVRTEIANAAQAMADKFGEPSAG